MIYTAAIYTEITYTAMLDETFVALHRKPQMWSIYANPSGVEVRKIFIPKPFGFVSNLRLVTWESL